jgi:heme oxygenase (mycobilin-producing)
MVERIRVLLYASSSVEKPAVVSDIYHHISERLIGTPGLVSSELLQEFGHPNKFIIMSEWSSIEAFRTWEDGPDHRPSTAPLRPYHDESYAAVFGIYKVAAEYYS